MRRAAGGTQIAPRPEGEVLTPDSELPPPVRGFASKCLNGHVSACGTAFASQCARLGFMTDERAAHWEGVYRTKSPDAVSWYQPTPATSLALVDAAHVPTSAPVIDVGAGASALVDGLLDRGFRDVTLLDLSASALDVTRGRLGLRASSVTFVVADVTAWQPSHAFGLWHDRAVFHFLAEASQREAYRRVLAESLAPGAVAILATFGENGPEKCSGLPVRRYSVESLAAEFRDVLELEQARTELHTTPWQSTQEFVFGRFRRRGA